MLSWEKGNNKKRLQMIKKVKLPVDPALNTKQIQADYEAVYARYGSNPTYWWSSIMWSSDKDAREHKPFGPSGVCAFLDTAGVPTGFSNASSFAELNVRWHGTFSALTHATVLGSNAMLANGGRSMGWQVDANVTRLAVLALAGCAEIIPACEHGLDHPKAGWARMYLGDLRDKAVLAQAALEGTS